MTCMALRVSRKRSSFAALTLSTLRSCSRGETRAHLLGYTTNTHHVLYQTDQFDMPSFQLSDVIVDG